MPRHREVLFGTPYARVFFRVPPGTRQSHLPTFPAVPITSPGKHPRSAGPRRSGEKRAGAHTGPTSVVTLTPVPEAPVVARQIFWPKQAPVTQGRLILGASRGRLQGGPAPLKCLGVFWCSSFH